MWWASPGVLAIRTLLPKLIAPPRGGPGRRQRGELRGRRRDLRRDAPRRCSPAEVNLLTRGNHIWTKKQILPWVERNPDLLLRPANYPKGAPGKGHTVIQTPDGRKLGRAEPRGPRLHEAAGRPVHGGARLVAELRKRDALHPRGHALRGHQREERDGRATSTARCRRWWARTPTCRRRTSAILPGGTAFITDVGMCGPLDSVIGMKKELVHRALPHPAPHPLRGGEEPGLPAGRDHGHRRHDRQGAQHRARPRAPAGDLSARTRRRLAPARYR